MTTGWRDIETAPKDGTRFIGLWVVPGCPWRVFKAHWVEDLEAEWAGYCDAEDGSAVTLHRWMPFESPETPNE